MSQFEDKLSDSWSKCLGGDKAAFQAMTTFYRVMRQAAEENNSEVLLIDVGPNLGTINRAALIAVEYIVIPLAPGLFSLQGLRNLGSAITRWREGWKQRLAQKPNDLNIPMPTGKIKPAGYIIMQQIKRGLRPVRAYQEWIEKIPQTYRKYVLNINEDSGISSRENLNEIGLIRNYQSLMPLAQEARKPIFLLKPAEGAIGAHSQSVSRCYTEFKKIAESLLNHAVDW